MRVLSIKKPSRLDLEFSLFLGGCVALLVIVGLVGGILLSKMEQKRLTDIERDYIDRQLKYFRESIGGEIAAGNHLAVGNSVRHIQRALDLNRLTVRYPGHVEESKKEHHPPSLITSEAPLLIGDTLTGTISYESGSRLEGKLGKVLIFVILLFFIFILLLSVFVSRWLQTRYFDPIRELVALCGREDALKQLKALEPNSFELAVLREQFSVLVHDQAEKHNQILLLEKKKSLADLARQVAHDIRSPLTALRILMDETDHLPEDLRLLVRGAVTRIQDIANNLLSKNEPETKQSHHNRQRYILSAVLDSFTSQLRLQYRDKPKVNILTLVEKGAYGHFSNFVLSEFRVVISNLVNNAVESYGDNGGPVVITLSSLDDSFVSISISDKGGGIAPEVLRQIGKSGASFKKATGLGLGLAHARKTVEAWGGELGITSKLHEGTEVSIRLKRAEPPRWFVPALEIFPRDVIVVLDDDDAIHHTWDRLLSPYLGKGNQVYHFKIARELEIWLKSRPQAPFLGLFDQELIGQGETGLQIIKQYSLESQAIIVTSQHDDKYLLKECEKHSIRIIPKILVEHIPVIEKKLRNRNKRSSSNFMSS